MTNILNSKIIILLLGLINIIKDIEIIEIGGIGIKRENVILSGIIILLYNIINKWIKRESKWKEIEMIKIINIISILLFINISKQFGFLFILLELFIMSVYILFYFNSNNISSYTNLLYFFINSISSLILLLLIALIYYNYSIIEIKDLIYINNSFYLQSIIIILIFKLGLYPFQYWVITTYKQLDFRILLFQSIFSTFIYLYFLSFLISSHIYLYFFSFLNIIIIPIIAIKSDTIKDILIYSSIYNTSIILLTLINNETRFIFYYYLFIYFINTFLLFLSLFNNSYFLSFLLFSLIGIPPFGGFYIKLIVMMNFLNLNNKYNSLIILLIILSSFLSSLFYLKLISFNQLSFIQSNSPSLLFYFLFFFLIFFSFFQPYYFFFISSFI